MFSLALLSLLARLVSSSNAFCTGSHPETISLSQQDFINGTYRIMESGYYILTSDIIFSPRENLEDPNEECAWFPCNDENYPGSGSDEIEGPFILGFFAAITIETNNVTINLCGNTLRMSDEFYLQQRFYANIQVSSAPFESGQGPADFISDEMIYVNNTVIINGTLGLSSHHGILGHGPRNLKIEDLIIKDFEVAGIQINGFNNLIISNVKIGPINVNVIPSGFYSAARFLLSQLRNIVYMNPDYEVQFDDRAEKVTLQDILDELVFQMDLFFNYTLGRLDMTELLLDDESYKSYLKSMEIFRTKNGFPDGSSTYGILLNSFGVAVNNFGDGSGRSFNAVLENIRIHDLNLETTEFVAFVDGSTDAVTMGPNGNVIDINTITYKLCDIDMSENVEDLRYYGNAVADAQMIIAFAGNRRSVFQTGRTLSVSSNFRRWVQNGEALDGYLRCNGDIMGHFNKGVFGLRIDETENVKINELTIENLNNWSELGTLVCGEYTNNENGGHASQFDGDTYGAVHNRAITVYNSSNVILSNIQINHVSSLNGDCIGIDILDNSSVIFNNTISVNNINGGIGLRQTDIENINPPNNIPIVCDIASNTLNKMVRLDENEVNISDLIMTGEISCLNDTESITEHSRGSATKFEETPGGIAVIVISVVILIVGVVLLAGRRLKRWRYQQQNFTEMAISEN